jgi:hypothetical protein
MAQNAKSFENREYDIGLSAGIWFPGTVTIELLEPVIWTLEVDKSSSPLFRAIADYYITPKFAVGAYANFSFFTLSKDGYDLDASMFELGAALKPRILLAPNMALKPGFNLGYRRINRDSVGSGDTETGIDGFGINLSVELQYRMRSGHIVYLDGGFLTEPYGETSNTMIEFGPIFYLLAGYCF